MNLPYVHEKLVQSYERSAKQIWIFNVGDLKPLEIPINFAMDLAFNIDEYHMPNSTQAWTQAWATSNYGAALAPQISQLMMQYSLLAGRRKYELLDYNFFSLVNYNEFQTVISEWTTLAVQAQAVYNQLPPNAKASFFEMILHPSLAGMTLYHMYYATAKNNLYAEQGRNSANQYLMQVFDYVNQDANLTMAYNSLLSMFMITPFVQASTDRSIDSKWSHMMDVSCVQCVTSDKNDNTHADTSKLISATTITGSNPCVTRCLLWHTFRPSSMLSLVSWASRSKEEMARYLVTMNFMVGRP